MSAKVQKSGHSTGANDGMRRAAATASYKSSGGNSSSGRPANQSRDILVNKQATAAICTGNLK